MANSTAELELLKGGMTTNQISKGVGWIQNLYRRNGAWTLRPGFGQLTQIDSTMTAGIQRAQLEQQTTDEATLTGKAIGYSTHLGSHYIQTDFGHEQIISVFKGSGLTGNSDGQSGECGNTNLKGVKSFIADFCFVDIYDITTDTHWEEVLVSKTSQQAGNKLVPMGQRQAVYATTASRDLQGFITPPTDMSFYFAEMNDMVFLGNREVGVFAYRPCVFKRRRKNQTNTFWNTNATENPFGESSRLVNVYFGPGDFGDQVEYFTTSEVGKPNDVSVILNSMAYALDREVLFSDVNNPSSIMVGNNIVVPSQQTITAIQEINGNLMIFTSTETFLYMPSVITDGLISSGRIIKLNEGIGCLSPNSIAKIGNSIYFLDRNGIYQTNGQSIQSISTSIDNLFNEYLTNPLTSFYLKDGDAGVFETGARHNYNVEDTGNINISYDITNDLVFVSIPKQNYVLVYKDGGWSIWTFDSILQGGTEGSTTPTAISENITNPWLLPTHNKVYLVGSMDKIHVNNNTQPSGDSATGQNYYNQSYYICEWGRGGALDRTANMFSVGAAGVFGRSAEDKRKFVGEWDVIKADGENAAFVFEKPIRMPVGTQIDQMTAGDEATEPILLQPISIYWNPTNATIIGTELPLAWAADFLFDMEGWKPFLQNDGNAGELVYFLSNDRRWTADDLYGGVGYGLAAMGAANQVRLHTTAGAVSNDLAAANRIKINGTISNLDGNLPTTGGTGLNQGLNIVPGIRSTMIYIPFQRQTYGTQEQMCLWNLGVGGFTESGHTQAFQTKNAAAATQTTDPDVYIWKSDAGLGFEYPALDADDNKFVDENLNAQPVDWCYKSEQVGIEGAEQVRARGLYSLIKSTGVGTTGLIASVFYGIFNTLLGSDWKGWTSQICDYTPTEDPVTGVGSPLPKDLDKIQGLNPIRTRTRNTAATLKHRVFADEAVTANNPAHWDTDFLIDDQELDVLATSDSVKGKSISYMLFGFANNIAEKLQIGSVKAAIRKAGGRRRKGRSGG